MPSSLSCSLYDDITFMKLSPSPMIVNVTGLHYGNFYMACAGWIIYGTWEKLNFPRDTCMVVIVWPTVIYWKYYCLPQIMKRKSISYITRAVTDWIIFNWKIQGNLWLYNTNWILLNKLQDIEPIDMLTHVTSAEANRNTDPHRLD